MCVPYIYILHFSEPFKHAKHYVGSSINPRERIKLHRKGRSGVCLINAVVKEGILLKLGNLIKSDSRNYEKLIKKIKNTKRFCKFCNPEKYKIISNNLAKIKEQSDPIVLTVIPEILQKKIIEVYLTIDI